MRRFQERLVQWYLDLSLSSKIYIPNFIIILLLIFISGFIAHNLTYDLMIERIINSTQQSQDIIIQSLDSVLNEVETGALRVASDPIVQRALVEKNKSNQQQEIESYPIVDSILEKTLNLRNFVDRVSVYRLDGTLLATSYFGEGNSIYKKMLPEAFLKMVLDLKEKYLWTDPGSLKYTFEQPITTGPSMFRVIRKGNLGDILGILEVNMNKNIFSCLYSHLDYGRTGRFIVINRNGVLVFPETSEYSLYREFFRTRYLDLITDYNTKGKITTFGKEQFVVTSRHLERLGWLIVGMVPLNELLGYGKRLTLTIYAIGLFCIVFEILFAIWISSSISRPIRLLSDYMRDAAEGDMQIRMPLVRKDEIGLLSRSFNDMLEQISSLMDQVYSEQKRERELELIALQSQINPHFLYNSLESICALSQLNRNEDAYTLSKALSMFYRGVLSRGKQYVSIRDELATLQYYFTIQEIRYRDKFSYSISVEEDLYDKQIIKLTLQPLVENSIYHGLKNVRREGRIWILGKKEGKNRIRLTVMDNGIGIDEKTIEDLMNGSITSRDKNGYGFTNVNQRIKLSFGDEYGLSIQSRPGYWTKVHILIPSIQEG
ncbi:MAG: sensor histidine kinase [Spirochaetales bacterium]|nr:sensor histidine kinase [Spirochaetales bacterium]